MQHYVDLVNKLVDNNITPVVTLYHYDLPQALQEAGGWTSDVTVDRFEMYARTVFENLGDKVSITSP